jgi:hypothetical protein
MFIIFTLLLVSMQHTLSGPDPSHNAGQVDAGLGVQHSATAVFAHSVLVGPAVVSAGPKQVVCKGTTNR